jgi:transposase InsO family protein
LAEHINEFHDVFNHILGYRRMTEWINYFCQTNYTYSRVRKVMGILNIHSCIRRKKKKYKGSAPEVVADNKLKRRFHVTAPNQVWCTDVTEFKYKGKKLYLSAIIDLYDRSIVAYVISDRNDSKLVFDTFNQARDLYPDAAPMFHSDRGFQYTMKAFQNRLKDAGMEQSMSRVGCCIDNGPCEGFWGIIKSEMYHNPAFKESKATRGALIKAIEEYIDFYNYVRPQGRFGMKAPMAVRNDALHADNPADYPIAYNKKVANYWADIHAKQMMSAMIN